MIIRMRQFFYIITTEKYFFQLFGRFEQREFGRLSFFSELIISIILMFVLSLFKMTDYIYVPQWFKID